MYNISSGPPGPGPDATPLHRRSICAILSWSARRFLRRTHARRSAAYSEQTHALPRRIGGDAKLTALHWRSILLTTIPILIRTGATKNARKLVPGIAGCFVLEKKETRRKQTHKMLAGCARHRRAIDADNIAAK